MAVEPEKKYAVAFVDGQNLYRHAKDAFGHHHPNYDIVKLHKAVCGANGWEPTLVRFYTGVPRVEYSELWSGYWSSRVLAMKRAGIVVTTRPVRYHTEDIQLDDGSTKTITVPQEKGIDVRLALDVVHLARTAQFNVGVIYSQDQDLAEVVTEVKSIAQTEDRWIRIASAFPDSPTASSKRGIDGAQWIKINQETYDACLDPRDYRPAKFR